VIRRVAFIVFAQRVGLGDVYLQYAAAITDARQLLDSDALRQSEDAYTLAESQAALATDVPQLLPLARLGLGLTKQIRGKAHFDLDGDRRTWMEIRR